MCTACIPLKAFSVTQTHRHTETETETETQRHRDTETQRHRDTETQRHRDTETQRHRDTETQRHRDTQTQRHTDTHTHTDRQTDTDSRPLASGEAFMMKKIYMILGPRRLSSPRIWETVRHLPVFDDAGANEIPCRLPPCWQQHSTLACEGV